MADGGQKTACSARVGKCGESPTKEREERKKGQERRRRGEQRRLLDGLRNARPMMGERQEPQVEEKRKGEKITHAHHLRRLGRVGETS